MKKALIGFASVILILIFILIWFTLDGRNVRQTELNNAVTIAMENAMELLLVEDGKPTTVEEWEAMLIPMILVQIDSEVEQVEINVISADLEKGLLSVEVVETFRNPNGDTGQISVRRSCILEEYTK